MASRLKLISPWVPFLAILALYAILIIPTVDRLGIGWDEEVDLRIARAYLTLRGLFFGTPLDLSQTRLPMFIVAFIYRILGVSNLLLARLISVAVGGGTLFGIYLYGKEHFNQKIGLFAAGLLAVNPFFLSFSRLAFTESDIYLAFTLTWLLIAVARLQEKRTIGRSIVAGIFLGLSISAKATALIILPAVWVALYMVRFSALNTHQIELSDSFDNPIHSRVVWSWAGCTVGILFIAIYTGVIIDIGTYPVLYQLLRYGAISLGWLITLGWAFRFRNRSTDPISLIAFVTGFGLLTFLIFPPDHLTNPGILRSLFLRAENEMSFNVAYMAELTALHLLTLFFKSTPALGFTLLVGIAANFFHWRQRALMFPLLLATSYFVGLLLLPLGQTFYMIPILPVLSLLAAKEFFRLWSLRKIVALMIAVLTVSWWGVEMIQCYPDYHLNGYQWVGERVLFGRSSIGYASVVFTPEDGVQQAMEWLNENVEPGQVAQLYFNEWHIVRYLAPEPDYLLIDGKRNSLLSKPDFVAIHINALHAQGFGQDTPQGDINLNPFDQEILEQEYEKVFAVQRAFRLEVSSIWQRK